MLIDPAVTPTLTKAQRVAAAVLTEYFGSAGDWKKMEQDLLKHGAKQMPEPALTMLCDTLSEMMRKVTVEVTEQQKREGLMAATELSISAEERREITMPATQIISEAKRFLVVDDQGYADGGERLKAIKAAQKALEAKKRSLLDPVNATLKAIRALFSGPENDLTVAEGLYKRTMLAYSDAQERQRREEQRQADERAAAERRRLEQEAADREAAAAKSREAGRETVAARQEAKADMLRDQAAATVAPVVQREAPRVAGVVERENWYALVMNKSELIKAVAAGTVPETALEPNMKFLNNQAKAMKRDLRYPGVQAAVDKIMAAGSK